MQHSHITPPTPALYVHLKGRNLNNSIGTIATHLRKEQGTTVLERGTEVIEVIEDGTCFEAPESGPRTSDLGPHFRLTLLIKSGDQKSEV